MLSLMVFASACKKENKIPDGKLEKVNETITYHLKNGGQITVTINNKGEYVVGGDVILSKDQIAYLEYHKINRDKTTTPRSTFTSDFQKLWPGGKVYYVVSDPSNAGIIQDAISEWEANTPIDFVPRTNQANYIEFIPLPANEPGAGDSQLGMVGGRQEIRIKANMAIRTAVHEIGHAIGLMHEHLRADRDSFIDVNYSNINSTWTSQYDIYSLGTGDQLGPFDYASVMLYPSYAPSASNGGDLTPQMTRKDGSVWYAESHLSAGDIEGVNYLYNNPVYAKLVSVYYEEGSYYSSGVTNENARSEYFISVEFFSDPGFTIPTDLVHPIKFRYGYNSYTMQGSSGYPQLINVPAGEHSVYLGSIITEYASEYGNYMYYNSSSISIMQGIGYKF